jgi:NADPH:quinone reductase-like Zn-dependent oxidoreductase
MKAIIQRQYGDESTLHIVNRAEPMLRRGHEIKIKVHVANITSGDRNINTLALNPFLKFVMQIIFGFGKPRASIRGISGAGEVIEIGKDVNLFKVGDRVNFINSFGASVMAEYLILKQSQVIATFDKTLSFADASPLSFGAMTAYHFLNEKTLRPNQRVLIYGASGSVGTAAITLAKYFKAHVTAVASQKHHAALQTLSPDSLVDYQTKGFAQLQETYDVVFDAVGKMLPNDRKRLLKKQGKFYSVKSMTKESSTRLQTLNELMTQGKIKLVNLHQFNFTDFQKAHRVVYAGHQTGNTLLWISKDIAITQSNFE